MVVTGYIQVEVSSKIFFFFQFSYPRNNTCVAMVILSSDYRVAISDNTADTFHLVMNKIFVLHLLCSITCTNALPLSHLRIKSS